MKSKSKEISLREREKQLFEMKDSNIDYSEIPPITRDFIEFVENKKQKKQTKQGLYLLVKPEVLQWYRNLGRGYQGTINAILEAYIELQENTPKKSLPPSKPKNMHRPKNRTATSRTART